MRVGELKRLLEAFPDDMPVVVNGYEDGFDNAAPPILRNVILHVYKVSYYGPHADADDEYRNSFLKGRPRTPVCLIARDAQDALKETEE